MNDHLETHRALLGEIARRAMISRGLEPEFPKQALDELARIQDTAPAQAAVAASPRDLRGMSWCSIDNDDSLDLDQLTVADPRESAEARIFVAVADVDSLVPAGGAIDSHARRNTTSVYTAARVFPMLPERLSTNLTSLNAGEDRLAIVIEMLVGSDGALLDSGIYQAQVRNHAKLAYNSLAAWLDGEGPMPEPIARVPGLDANLRLQNRTAAKLKSFRHEHGALDLETIEARPVLDGDLLSDLQVEKRNCAKQLIEDFMVAANGVTARFLGSKARPSIRRIVRVPARWDRIVELAAGLGGNLPPDPDSGALEGFLATRRTADPLRFPDLSLAVIKLMGPGEYVVERPGEDTGGHFGLAVRDYAHSTAPNRRYPDLVTQRLLKAALAGLPTPYGETQLGDLARHCTEMENAAEKVERQVRKSAAAILLGPRIGARFEAVVTGASEKGTWVRLLHPPVEGKLQRGFKGLDVGDRLRVKLVHTDVEQGFIDFVRA